MPSTGQDRPDAAQHQRMVQRQSALDFFDPSFEWRRIFAETWGTFLLVLVAAGGGTVAAMSGGRVTLGMMVVAPGIMVMAIIYFMGAVSGAHLNPAVTLAFAVRRNFPWKRVPGYMIGQVIGGIGAATIGRVRETGAQMAAVISALVCDDVEVAARELVARWEHASP